ncbi:MULTISPECIES: threonine/serine exporter family protein [Staphylococcus]|uniref:Threonine/serine exporter family protein n=1 Tax=Staphylococcus hsinchuensis TaxID=3051183 RepID=A0ABZ3ECQ7_9STAP|nr:MULTISPECIES: threonine/serine exporter family protein [unclassified Staphylococcus]
MTLLLHIVLSFLTSFAFSFIYNSPKRTFVYSGLAGCCGYMASYLVETYFGIDSIYSKFIGSLALGCVSQILARKFKVPVISFLVTGLIPLVPGSIISRATQKLIQLNFGTATPIFIEGMLIASSIALGLLISNQIAKMLGFNQVTKEDYYPN